MKLLALLTAAVFLGCSSLWAQESAEAPMGDATKTVFVDLDGDGLNDNLRDVTGDGIPEFDNSSVAPPTMSGGQATTINLDDVLGASMPGFGLALSRSEAFAGHRFGTRGICRSRGGFGAEDSFALTGTMGLSATGGQCAGGVCHF